MKISAYQIVAILGSLLLLVSGLLRMAQFLFLKQKNKGGAYA